MLIPLQVGQAQENTNLDIDENTRIIQELESGDLSWAETYALMELVSQLKNEKFGEIMDTAVPELQATEALY